ncbi:MAG: histidine phosphatase family protein [Myxococcota bacterium]|nr:histidine phosphatase family protein [Myxococcota bacterium]
MTQAQQTVLTLVRHGETQANLDGIWHGSTDTPLTDRGHAQAERVGKWTLEQRPDAAALYASHLQRARHTAAAIARLLGLEVRVDEELGEYDLGAWEGKTYVNLFEEHRLWHHMKSDPDFAPHGGESPRQVAERLASALHRIAAQHPGERVIVVTHGGALSLGLAQLLEGDYKAWTRVMDNCSVTELTLHPKPSLLCFNETAHLAGV